MRLGARLAVYRCELCLQDPITIATINHHCDSGSKALTVRCLRMV